MREAIVALLSGHFIQFLLILSAATIFVAASLEKKR